MSASTLSSTTSPAKVVRTTGGTWLWLLTAALVCAYAAPWLLSQSAALSFGGYDLAEWASLPPGVRSAMPPLVASFLLRATLTALTLFVIFASPYRRFSVGWLVVAVVALALVAAQLPPFEFITVARGDPNYGQQAALALVSLVGVVIGLLTQPGIWRVVLASVWALLGAVFGVAGALSAQTLLAAYGLQPALGSAVTLTALLFVVAAVWCAYRFVRLVGARNG